MVHAINGVLYFNAMDGSSGQELWKHDHQQAPLLESMISDPAHQAAKC